MTTIPQLTEEGTSRMTKAAGMDNMNIHYHEAGQGDPVIFLHSYNIGTTGWINWRYNFEALSQHFRCILMDHPNYGRTGPIVYNEPQHHVRARTALNLMDALGIQKAHIVGNSNGGTTALVMAIHNQDRVNKIVVGACHASSGGDPYLIANRPSEGSKANRDAGQNPTRENIRHNMEIHLDNQALVTDELVEYMYKSRHDHPENAEALSKSVGIDHSNFAALHTIKAPTLVIHGRYDRMVPVEVGLALMNYIPDSRLLVFNHCGHWPQYEHPKEYNAQVLNFLQMQ